MTIQEIKSEIENRALESGHSCNLHLSAGGSQYQHISYGFDFPTCSETPTEGYTIRFSDHANGSVHSDKPDWAFLDYESQEQWAEELKRIEFGKPAVEDNVLVKKSIMAELAGLTIPALKKRLSTEAYTTTQVVKLSVALKELGIDAENFVARHLAAPRSTVTVAEYPIARCQRR